MDVVIIGAGIWGACSAYSLQKAGFKVKLYDLAEPGNTKSGSGGLTRIIRLSYGSDELYTDLTFRSYKLWQEIIDQSRVPLYQETGLLWLFSQDNTQYVDLSIPKIHNVGTSIHKLDHHQAVKNYPQINFSDIKHTYHEPQAGILYADACCKAVVKQFLEIGGQFIQAKVEVDESMVGKNSFLRVNGKTVEAGYYVFACGPWTNIIFPELIKPFSYVSRHEVYYASIHKRQIQDYSYPNLPIWFDYNEKSPMYYGIPHQDGYGFKFSSDDRSVEFNSDDGDLAMSPGIINAAKKYLLKRFPDLEWGGLQSFRNCPYDNSLDGHFIMDDHPENKSLIVLAGSSGHGFKMGPALGELVMEKILNGKDFPERFSLRRFKDV